MAVVTESVISNTLQGFFSKKLLEHAVQKTVLNQFAEKAELPKKRGNTTVHFFRRQASAVDTAGTVANVQALSEGTAISTFASFTFTKVDATLTQYGEAAKITDITSWKELFDTLKTHVEAMGEDCALFNDGKISFALVAGLTNKIYAQGLTSHAALNSASASAGKATILDFVRAATQLKINRAPSFGGKYVAAIPMQVTYDLQNDPDWLEVNKRAQPSRIFNGEIGEYGGVKFVEHSNPFRESTTAATYDGTGSMYRSWVLGKGAYGVPAIEGGSFASPSIVICSKADKADPLNQFMTAGWKTYWVTKVLDASFGVSVTSKTEYS
jgi:N4-gp56 family major capsid protein